MTATATPPMEPMTSLPECPSTVDWGSVDLGVGMMAASLHLQAKYRGRNENMARRGRSVVCETRYSAGFLSVYVGVSHGYPRWRFAAAGRTALPTGVRHTSEILLDRSQRTRLILLSLHAILRIVAHLLAGRLPAAATASEDIMTDLYVHAQESRRVSRLAGQRFVRASPSFSFRPR